ncbi:facilitated trehalose transporter Tret1-like [Diabrotica virgifera virgifera]|uniref:Facilitated trehalose transporter Tret1-like n=1 Tax=Diabrotica virgifera virgifera TaxID=50390 RepID=A0A6P7FBQ5_DIAVI|nr:facilitated trehalose transporter Tret1-like [Diabrotica virgifera virgifera]
MVDKSRSNELNEVKYIPVDDGVLKPIHEEKKSDTFYFYFVVLTGTLPILVGGSAFSWTSPVLPKLLSNDSSINPLEKPITTVEISMLIGLPCLTGLMGSLLAAPLSDRFGRKKCMQIFTFVMFLCNIFIAFSNRVLYLIVLRCIFFVGMFGIMAVVPVFVTEICENHNRAKYGCVVGLFSPLGNLYSYILGPLFSVRVFTLVSNIPAVIFLVSFIFAPESPFFSVYKGKDKDCIKALRKLRNNKSDIELHKDFSEITKSIEIKVSTVNPGISALFKIKEARVGLFLISIPMVTQFLSGAPTLMPFVGPIFNKAATNLSGNTIAIIVGAVKCSVFIIPTFIVERTGRKPLMIGSSLGCSVSMILVGTYFYLQHINSPLAQQLSWLPIISVIIVIFSYAVGLGPVPMSLTGELFATDVRAVASSITMTVAGLAIFAVATIFPIAAELVGLHWCFWVFSINCLVGAVSIYLFLPETKGRRLVEIQEILKNYKFGLRK